MPSSPQRKTSAFGIHVKNVGPETGDTAGGFKAIVSAFGNVDSVGDVVMPGAFGKSLAKWAESGDPIPVLWSHDWNDPFSHIGAVQTAAETDDGLEIDAVLDVEHNEKAAQVHRLLKSRRLKQFSFAYDIAAASPGRRDGKAVTELTELDILEVGPCLVGANRSTALLEVKAQPLTPRITPAELAALAGPAPTITPAGLSAWAGERNH